MIQITNLTKKFGSQLLFDNIDLKINPKEKVGLVGRNGFGKTTLLKLLIGEEEADSGIISIPRNYKISYVRQNISFTENTTLKEGVLGLSKEHKDEEWLVKKTLFGLGFDDKLLEINPLNLSGGFQVRLNLAKTLLSNANLLLLDEPTNYLDITSIRWLIKFLKSWNDELILVTHDRSFMDEIATHIAGIHRNKIKKIKGITENYYLQVAQEEEIYEKERLNTEKKVKKQEIYISKFRAKARLAGQVQSRIKKLEKMDIKEKLSKIKILDFEFNYDKIEAPTLMQVKDLTFSYEKNVPLINRLNFVINRNDRIAVIGPNGKGKTTLLKLLHDELKKDSGEIIKNSRTSFGYFGQTNKLTLHPENTIEEEISMEVPGNNIQVARNVTGALLFEKDDALKKIKVLSGGEKSRVLLAKILVKPANMLLLDEPTNHFDMESSDSLLSALDNFDGACMIVTHNQMFLHAIPNRLLVFDAGKIFMFEGTYEEFLEKIGWESEKNEPFAENEKIIVNQNINKKELRKKRAEIVEEKSKAIKPVESKYKHLEKQIEKLELELKINNEEFLLASAASDGEKINRLSKLIHEIENKINKLYNEFEEVMNIYDEKLKFYDEKLNSIEE